MELKCPMCGGAEFDGPRRLIAAGYGSSCYVIKWFRPRPLRVRARACLKCGHVTMGVDPDELRWKLGGP